MTTQEQPKDFGRYLQACRISKGISLDAVSRLTRITMAILKQIESEDIGHLPAPVFVKGFLRSYAEAVGADKDEALARYESSLQIIRKAEHTQTSWEKQSPYLPRIFIALVLIGAVIAFTLYVSGRFFSETQQEQPVSARAPEKEPPPARVAPPDETTQPAPIVEPQVTSSTATETQEDQSLTLTPQEDSKTAPEEKKRIVLKLVAVEPTWLKIIADDQVPQEYTLDVGDTLSLEAQIRFSLLIGNAAGVQLTLDGKPVAVPGKSGQVVTLQLPKG